MVNVNSLPLDKEYIGQGRTAIHKSDGFYIYRDGKMELFFPISPTCHKAARIKRWSTFKNLLTRFDPKTETPER